MTLSTRISAAVAATLAGTAEFGSSPTFELSLPVVHALGNGTGTGQADKLFADQNRTLAASASETLDLAGALTDPIGQALTFAKVKAILVKAADGNTNTVVVGGAASNGFLGPFADATDKVAIPPGGIMLVTAPRDGWPVTAGTGDLFKVANGGGGTSVGYDVVIVGTSA